MYVALPGSPLTCPPVSPPQLFQKCRLVMRILDAWEENDKIQ